MEMTAGKPDYFQASDVLSCTRLPQNMQGRALPRIHLEVP